MVGAGWFWQKKRRKGSEGEQLGGGQGSADCLRRCNRWKKCRAGWSCADAEGTTVVGGQSLVQIHYRFDFSACLARACPALPCLALTSPTTANLSASQPRPRRDSPNIRSGSTRHCTFDCYGKSTLSLRHQRRRMFLALRNSVATYAFRSTSPALQSKVSRYVHVPLIGTLLAVRCRAACSFARPAFVQRTRLGSTAIASNTSAHLRRGVGMETLSQHS